MGDGRDRPRAPPEAPIPGAYTIKAGASFPFFQAPPVCGRFGHLPGILPKSLPLLSGLIFSFFIPRKWKTMFAVLFSGSPFNQPGGAQSDDIYNEDYEGQIIHGLPQKSFLFF